MSGFVRARFEDLAGWREADTRPALSAFARSARGLLDGRFRTGQLGIDAGAYRVAAENALDWAEATRGTGTATTGSAEQACHFFETHFLPLRIVTSDETAASASDRPAADPSGFVTGYYEPEVAASPVRTARYRFPLYARPADLVKVDDVSRPPGMDASFRFARRMPCGLLTEYYDRAAIESGALAGQGLEIAWLDDPVEAFFIHVQGSARLTYENGETVRVGYAAKTGHPFTAIGRWLVEAGELTLEDADMTGIRAWLGAHPDRMRALFDRNRSFIFFDLKPVDNEGLGPVGAAGVPLTPLASIAVDRELSTFGVPFFIEAPDLAIGGSTAFRRLMIAQDTGSAILGPARADIFVGSGDAAGKIAGGIRHRAVFHLLAPRALAERLAS